MVAYVLHSRLEIQPQTPTHLVQLLYPPDQQWVTGGVLEINIICRGSAREGNRKREWKQRIS